MSTPNIVNEVVQAYETLRWKPVSCSFFEKHGKKVACCGLSALAISRGAISKYDCKKETKVQPWAEETLGKEYAGGFINGFDDGGCSKPKASPKTDTDKGYSHGFLAAKKLGLHDKICSDDSCGS